MMHAEASRLDSGIAVQARQAAPAVDPQPPGSVVFDARHTRPATEIPAQQTGRRRPIVVDTEWAAPLQGSDRAMFPLEQLLAALASCLTTTLVWRRGGVPTCSARGSVISCPGGPD